MQQEGSYLDMLVGWVQVEPLEEIQLQERHKSRLKEREEQEEKNSRLQVKRLLPREEPQPGSVSQGVLTLTLTGSLTVSTWLPLSGPQVHLCKNDRVGMDEGWYGR